MKLQGTKSTISRMLLNNHREIGDEKTFYETVKTFEMKQSIARIYENVYGMRYERMLSRPGYLVKMILWCLEILFIVTFGLLNGWGSSTSRPLVFIVIIYLLFSVIYSLIPSSLDASSFQRAFDVGILAGYTNYGAEEFSLTRSIQSIHLGLSVVLYTVFFATAAARFSRVR